MAVFSSYADIGAVEQTSSRYNKKFRDVAAYAAVALIAMAAAIPTAIATAGADNDGLFTECFSASCEQSENPALLNK